MGLHDYLCHIPCIGDLVDLTSRVVLPPAYDFDSPPHIANEFRTFWVHNDIVEHILVGKLALDIASTIPPKRTGPFMLPTRTARDTLSFLRERYSVGSASTADILKDGVVNLTCTPGTVVKYVESWRNKFVNGLLNHRGWAILKDRVHQHWLRNDTLDHTQFSFESLGTESLDIYHKWKSLQRKTSSTPSTSSPSSSLSNSKSPTSDTLPENPPSRTPLKCTNCGKSGHTSDRCWDKGGGSARARANVAADVEVLSALKPIAEVAEVAEIAELDLDVPSSNGNDIFVSAYYLCNVQLQQDTPFMAFIQSSSPTSLAMFSTMYNTILDSGCTTHIVKDKKFFWSYDPSGAVDVGTANCGILSTLARGE
ncbi:hypothetical protein H0H92_008014, partial [Tricholoma furcatifolium]